MKGRGRTGAGATERAARSVAGAPASAPPKPPRGNNIPAACVVRRQPVMMTGIRPGAGSAARTAPVGAFSLAPARRTVARRANSRPRIGPRRASRPPHAARGLRSRGTRAGGGGLPPPRRGGGAVGGAEALGAFERAPGPRRLPSSLRRRRIAPRPAPRRDAGRLRLGRGLPPVRPGPDVRLASRRVARRRRPEDPPRARSGARDGALPPPPRRTRRRRRRRRPRHPATVPRRGGLRRRLLSRGGARRILRRLLRRRARRRVDARRSPRSPRGASRAEARGARRSADASRDILPSRRRGKDEDGFIFDDDAKITRRDRFGTPRGRSDDGLAARPPRLGVFRRAPRGDARAFERSRTHPNANPNAKAAASASAFASPSRRRAATSRRPGLPDASLAAPDRPTAASSARDAVTTRTLRSLRSRLRSLRPEPARDPGVLSRARARAGGSERAGVFRQARERPAEGSAGDTHRNGAPRDAPRGVRARALHEGGGRVRGGGARGARAVAKCGFERARGVEDATDRLRADVEDGDGGRARRGRERGDSRVGRGGVAGRGGARARGGAQARLRRGERRRGGARVERVRRVGRVARFLAPSPGARCVSRHFRIEARDGSTVVCREKDDGSTNGRRVARSDAKRRDQKGKRHRFALCRFPRALALGVLLLVLPPSASFVSDGASAGGVAGLGARRPGVRVRSVLGPPSPAPPPRVRARVGLLRGARAGARRGARVRGPARGRLERRGARVRRDRVPPARDPGGRRRDERGRGRRGRHAHDARGAVRARGPRGARRSRDDHGVRRPDHPRDPRPRRELGRGRPRVPRGDARRARGHRPRLPRRQRQRPQRRRRRRDGEGLRGGIGRRSREPRRSGGGGAQVEPLGNLSSRSSPGRSDRGVRVRGGGRVQGRARVRDLPPLDDARAPRVRPEPRVHGRGRPAPHVPGHAGRLQRRAAQALVPVRASAQRHGDRVGHLRVGPHQLGHGPPDLARRRRRAGVRLRVPRKDARLPHPEGRAAERSKRHRAGRGGEPVGVRTRVQSETARARRRKRRRR